MERLARATPFGLLIPLPSPVPSSEAAGPKETLFEAPGAGSTFSSRVSSRTRGSCSTTFAYARRGVSEAGKGMQQQDEVVLLFAEEEVSEGGGGGGGGGGAPPQSW